MEFFGRRGTPNPEVLADDTVDRVAHKLEEGERIVHLRAYVYGVARRGAIGVFIRGDG